MPISRLLYVAILAVIGLGTGSLEAARDDKAPVNARRLELVVLEVRNCNVCALVRGNIQPAYELSARSREVPMRFVDVTHHDEMRLGLSSPIEMLPTIVLLQEGREVDRISGYFAPEVMLRALGDLVDNAR